MHTMKHDFLKLMTFSHDDHSQLRTMVDGTKTRLVTTR